MPLSGDVANIKRRIQHAYTDAHHIKSAMRGEGLYGPFNSAIRGMDRAIRYLEIVEGNLKREGKAARLRRARRAGRRRRY